MQAVITDIDPFDLPDWLGTVDVVWRADVGLRTGHLVRGRLTASGADGSPQEIACDPSRSTRPIPRPWSTTRPGCACTRPGGTARW